MRINEIEINSHDALLDTLRNNNASKVLKLYQIIESASNKFTNNVHDVFSTDEIYDYVTNIKQLYKLIEGQFDNSSQTIKLINYLLSYFSGL